MSDKRNTGEGLRYNEGKLRYDLVQPWAHEQMVRVLTVGAKKYAERNWEKGMKWSVILASLERHLAAIKAGEDYDAETGELHAAHLACNAHFLSAYYKIYPQGDDRPHNYLNPVRIGLDIDEVLADFVGGYSDKYSIPREKLHWNFNYAIREHLEELKDDKEWWLNLKPLINSVPFEPHCYITSRIISSEWTMEWLENNGFPCRPVYTVGPDMSKVDIAKSEKLDIFVDDRFENFVELNNSGIACFLMDAPHNRKYKVGYKRIHSLNDIAPDGDNNSKSAI